MKTTTEIAIDLNMPVRVVQCVLTNWREIGDVCKDRARMGRAPLMQQSSVKVCISICTLSGTDLMILRTGIADAWAP